MSEVVAPLTPEQMARRAQRVGAWFYAECRLRWMKRYAITFGLESVGSPLLYMVAMGVGLGALVTRNSGDVGGVSYLVFVAPAIMVQTVAAAAMGEGTYPIIGGFIWDKTYQGVSATPVSPGQIALGDLLGCSLRFLAQALLFWALMLPFGAAPSLWSWLAIPIAAATAVAVMSPLQAFCSTIEHEKSQISFIQRFVFMPMSLFAGTYFPLSTMPGYLQWIGWVSPLWHGTQLARRACYSLDEPVWLTLVHVAVLVAYVLVGFAISLRHYRRRLRG